MSSSTRNPQVIERLANVVVPAMLNADQGHNCVEVSGKHVDVAWMNDGADNFTISCTVDGGDENTWEISVSGDERDAQTRILARQLSDHILD